jgi:hypothetical protein
MRTVWTRERGNGKGEREKITDIRWRRNSII